MSGYSTLRLFFRLEKPGRIPTFGNVGITHTTPMMVQQKQSLESDDGKRSSFFSMSMLERLKFIIPIRRYYSTSVSVSDVANSDAAQSAPKKKDKTLESPKIMLISETNKSTVLTLEEAHKMAQKKVLHLVPVDKRLSPVKTEKPIYKMVSNAEFMKRQDSEQIEEDFSVPNKDTKKKEKESKSVMMKSKIAEHDALSKIKQMNKWIEKGHPIRVVIGQPEEQGNSESVYKLIEEHMKETGARFLQKATKGNMIRFHLMPPKEPLSSTKDKKKLNEKNRQNERQNE